jgi:hypothetical protein
MPPFRDLLRPSQPPEDVVADDAEVPALAPDLPFHGVINKGTGHFHPRYGLNTVMVILGHGGLLVKRSAPVAFHHPKVGVGRLDDRGAFINIAAIEAVHGQDDGKQQAHPDHRGDKSASMQLQVIKG